MREARPSPGAPGTPRLQRRAGWTRGRPSGGDHRESALPSLARVRCALAPGSDARSWTASRPPAPRGQSFRPTRTHHAVTDPAAEGGAAVTAGPVRARVGACGRPSPQLLARRPGSSHPRLCPSRPPTGPFPVPRPPLPADPFDSPQTRSLAAHRHCAAGTTDQCAVEPGR